MEFIRVGFDLDRKVAAEVMGDTWVNEVIWEHRQDYWICTRNDIATGGSCPHIGKLLPAYSGDMTTAWKIVDKMHEQTFSVRHNFLKLIQELVSIRLFTKVQPENSQVAWPDVMLFTTPRDLCLAGIRAMELKKEIFEKHFGAPKA